MTYFTCAMVVGIYRPGLSTEERADFKNLFRREHEQFIGGAGPVLDGTSTVICCFPFVSGARRNNPFETGGACVVVITGGKNKQADAGHDSFDTGVLSDCDDDLSAFDTRLNGSWCFIGVDERNGRLRISRDAAGAQTVYFAKRNGAVYFTSSLTLFRNMGFDVDLDSVSDFLHFLYVPAPRTIYREVKSVLPGHCVSYDGKTLTETDLAWQASFERLSEAKDFLDGEDCVNAFEELLIKGVQSACPERGKAALFLSGGKDSSALAIAVHLGGVKNVEAVTLGFEEQGLDETDDARIVAQHLGIPFRSIKIPRAQYLEYWPEFIRCLGQPVGDFAALPVFSAARELGDEFEVFLDGTGNDGYFGITTSWQEDLAWYLHRLVPGLHHLAWGIIAKRWSYTADFLGRTLAKPREEQFVSWNGWTQKEIEQLTSKRPEWRKSRLYGMYLGCSSPMVHKTMTLCGIWEQEAAYRKVVQVVNTAGKSVRYPFLDHDLVRFVRNLPESWRHSERTNKVILRKLLQKYLPREILTKKKGAFNFPKAYVLASNDFEMTTRYLSPECTRKYGWVDPSVVEEYVLRYKKGDTALEDRLWSIVMLHAWAELRCN